MSTGGRHPDRVVCCAHGCNRHGPLSLTTRLTDAGNSCNRQAVDARASSMVTGAQLGMTSPRQFFVARRIVAVRVGHSRRCKLEIKVVSLKCEARRCCQVLETAPPRAPLRCQPAEMPRSPWSSCCRASRCTTTTPLLYYRFSSRS